MHADSVFAFSQQFIEICRRQDASCTFWPMLEIMSYACERVLDEGC